MQEADPLTPEELAATARAARARAQLTQQEVADRLGISKASISKAENYSEGDGMQNVRVRIIEALTGRQLEGPIWRFAEKS